MSSSESTMMFGLQELHDNLQIINDARHAIAAMFVLQLYEWLLLFDQEIRLIHKSRVSMINISYFLCRYYPIALWVLLMWGIVGDHLPELCLRVVKPINGLLAPCQLTSSAVMMMRAYAFTSRKRQVLILLGVCYAGLVCINIWVFCVRINVPVELYIVLQKTGCFPDYGEGTMAKRIGYAILGSTLMDLVSLIVVFVHCYKTHVRDVSLGRYFENQGLIAFALVCMINVMSVILYFRFGSGIGLPLTLVLPNLVACRVILQLRQRCQPLTETELAARTSRIVREAFNRRNTDAWTLS